MPIQDGYRRVLKNNRHHYLVSSFDLHHGIENRGHDAAFPHREVGGIRQRSSEHSPLRRDDEGLAILTPEVYLWIILNQWCTGE